ncbi:D-amino acid dehydrogenase [Acidisoma sp. C75]
MSAATPTASQSRVAVIGAGITGITTAYCLLRQGFAVSVFDRLPYAAMETSFANGGQLSASNAEVWNSWATILKGIKWMFTPGAPLLVHPAPSWHKLSWMAAFVANIPRYEENTVTTARLAIAARAHLLGMAEAEGIAFDCEKRGILHFYATKREFEAAGRVSALLAQAGLERQAVTPSEIRGIEPALSGDIYGGWYTPSDFTGDIHKFTHQLAAACARRGAALHFGMAVEGLRPDAAGVTLRLAPAEARGAGAESVRFDQVVICSGVRSRQLAAMAGDRLNIYPVKGYSITVDLSDPADQARAPWVSLLDDRAKIVTSRLGPSRFRVAGTAEFAGENKDIKAARIRPLIAWCHAHFPGMSTRQSVPWAGLRPMRPDMMPVVRQGHHPRVFYNTGHGHLGWTLSAATAEKVALLMAGQARPV